jgi:hypothetical protein
MSDVPSSTDNDNKKQCTNGLEFYRDLLRFNNRIRGRSYLLKNHAVLNRAKALTIDANVKSGTLIRLGSYISLW